MADCPSPLMPCWYDHFDLLYTYVLLLGIACLANHTAINFALYQPLYQVFIDMTSNELRPPWSNNWHTPWHNINDNFWPRHKLFYVSGRVIA